MRSDGLPSSRPHSSSAGNHLVRVRARARARVRARARARVRVRVRVRVTLARELSAAQLERG